MHRRSGESKEEGKDNKQIANWNWREINMSIWPVAIVAAMAAIMCHHHPENALRRTMKPCDARWRCRRRHSLVIYMESFCDLCLASAAPVIIVTHLCALTSMPRSIVSPSEHPKNQFSALFFSLGDCDDFVEFGRRNTGNRNYRCEFIGTTKAERANNTKECWNWNWSDDQPSLPSNASGRAICTSTKSNKNLVEKVLCVCRWHEDCTRACHTYPNRRNGTYKFNSFICFFVTQNSSHVRRTMSRAIFVVCKFGFCLTRRAGHTTIERTIGLFVSFAQFCRIRIDQQN